MIEQRRNYMVTPSHTPRHIIRTLTHGISIGLGVSVGVGTGDLYEEFARLARDEAGSNYLKLPINALVVLLLKVS